MGCDGVLHNCRFLFGSFFSRGRRCSRIAASNKMVKYAGLSSQGEFIPIAVESHGPINRDALQFLSELGRRLTETTGDVRASSFLFQRISVVVQRFNSVLLHDGFVDDDRPE